MIENISYPISSLIVDKMNEYHCIVADFHRFDISIGSPRDDHLGNSTDLRGF